MFAVLWEWKYLERFKNKSHDENSFTVAEAFTLIVYEIDSSKIDIKSIFSIL